MILFLTNANNKHQEDMIKIRGNYPMDDKTITRLNEFYNLETFQVSFYSTQYNLAPNIFS